MSGKKMIKPLLAFTRENIPGALIRLRGISSSQVITEDGQIREIDNTGINLSQVLTAGATTGGGDVKSTVTDGVWTLESLPYGAYVAEEERAPANYSLLPQHTSYSFWLLPGNVIIKLNQDESTVYVDDVWVSVHEALNAAIAGIQNYDNAAGLAAELQEILDTLLSQLQVDAVFTVEVDQSTNSQLITFENYPFGKIEVNKYDMVTELPLEGAHFRIQGYFADAIQAKKVYKKGCTFGVCRHMPSKAIEKYWRFLPVFLFDIIFTWTSIFPFIDNPSRQLFRTF